MIGWIKIHRKITDWEWYTDSTVFHLFAHLLIYANREAKCWKGIDLLPGQVVTGRESLALRTGISEQSIRTALNKLKSTGEITSKKYNKFSIITITNWQDYQDDDDEKEENQPANQPATNQQLTSNQPHLNKDKNIRKSRGTRFALDYPPPEWIDFCTKERPDLNVANVFQLFRDHWIAQPGQRGVKTDWLATWRNWIRKERGAPPSPQNNLFTPKREVRSNIKTL